MTKTKRAPRGEASIVVRSGRLSLRIPGNCFPDGKQSLISLDMADTSAGRTVAAQILASLQLDIYQGQIDPTLDKYRRAPMVTTVTALSLWINYVEYKKPTIKLSTLDYYQRTIGSKMALIPHSIDKALDVRDWLLKNTTQALAARCLDHLSSAVAWGIRHTEIPLIKNPYLGMGKEVKPKSHPPGADAFTADQKEEILNAFVGSRYYDRYFAFVYFLFLTGCRPSEAIGLRWGDIATDFSVVNFTGSIVRVNHKAVRMKRSKTNRVRSFPINSELSDLLQACSKKIHKADWLVFALTDDPYLPIDYENFYKRAWVKTVNPIVKRKTTPYSCRDTFITEQVAAGFPISVIAKWVDNSPRMISDRYFDISAVSFLPV
jgi:integrase